MNSRKKMTLLVTALLICAQPALAQRNDISISDGMGEEIQIKNGWFGGKSKNIQDRFGNKYQSSKGIFGGSQSEAAVLGNSIKRKKGWFGGSSVQGSTIFGDKVESKKGLFGGRKTKVDISGSAAVVKSLFASSKPKPYIQDPLPIPSQFDAPVERQTLEPLE
ncbi:MAG: hypothetical protein K2W82_04995 [Candidatus Obscuribacterales bacterium]|nr:hypothetical protein [Candidatus Obscuribacterales bacterium]